MTFLLDLGIASNDGELRFGVEEVPPGGGLRRVASVFHFIHPRSIEIGADRFEFRAGESIRLFFSYRYTPSLARATLRRYGLLVLDQWISASEEEGVFLATRA